MRSKFLKAGFLLLIATGIVTFFVLQGNAREEAPKPAEEKGIKFIEQDWSKALASAKDQKKLVFLDIYATWCGPCKMLKKNTFTDEKVAAFFNEHFVNVSVDGEATVGPELVRKYSLEGYPTLIVTDSEGKPVLYSVGYMDAANLLKFAEEAIKRGS